MPIPHLFNATGTKIQKEPKLGTVKRRVRNILLSKGRYRTKLVAKLIVLSAQLSNPIPAAAQDFSNDYRSGNAMSHFRHMPPELGTPLQDCIHPTEPDLTGHRYRVAQDSNQLLIWPDAARDANVRNLWIGTFSIASATTDPTTRPGGTVTP